MDTEVRALERRARASGEGAAFLAWARSRARAGERAAVALAQCDRVTGEALRAALRAALDGRREVEVLRRAGTPEKGHAHAIGVFRAFQRGAPIGWIHVERWAGWLGLEPLVFALLAERLPRDTTPAWESISKPEPTETVCANCRHFASEVALGRGYRCLDPQSRTRHGGQTPSRWFTCERFARHEPASGRPEGPMSDLVSRRTETLHAG